MFAFFDSVYVCVLNSTVFTHLCFHHRKPLMSCAMAYVCILGGETPYVLFSNHVKSYRAMYLGLAAVGLQFPRNASQNVFTLASQTEGLVDLFTFVVVFYASHKDKKINVSHFISGICAWYLTFISILFMPIYLSIYFCFLIFVSFLSTENKGRHLKMYFVWHNF